MENSSLPENKMEKIEAEKTEPNEISPEKTEQERDSSLIHKDKTPKGWLSFFLFTIVLGALVSVFSNLNGFSIEAYDSGQGQLFTFLGVSCDIIQIGGYLLLAIYTTYAFVTNRPNAVSLGKMYLISLFASNVLLLWINSIGESFETSGFGSMTQIIRSLIYSTIWFLYLTYSIQVEDLFPKGTRITKVKDIVFCILPPFISLLYFCLVLMMMDFSAYSM